MLSRFLSAFMQKKKFAVSQMGLPTADVVTGKNCYFACMIAWAANRSTGSLLDPTGLPASYTTLVPIWHQTTLENEI